MSTIPIRDVSLYVKVMGQGYPLVLMHGGPSLDHSTLLPLQPLAERYTLIFYDHRCNGRSSGDVTSLTWENLTADADALRETLGFDRWAMLGQSFGGMVALEYALRYPQRVSQLILLDTCADSRRSYDNAMELLARRGYSVEAVNAARRFFSGQYTPDEFLPTVMPFMQAYVYEPFPMETTGDVQIEFRPETHIYASRHLLGDWSVMDRLGEIRVPTLVMAGRYDFLFPPEHQAILADRLPDARLELIECAGHNPQMEQPAAVIGALDRFLEMTTTRRDWEARETLVGQKA